MPVYVSHGKNVCGLSSMKDYFGIWFYQGALLQDKNQVLINANPGKTQALRQWRMTSVKDIKSRFIKSYVLEAVSLAEQGKQIKPARNKPIHVPPELQKVLSNAPSLNKAFESLSKTYKREYTEYISDAKKEETKLRRIDKIVPMILEAKGLNDKYRQK